MIQSKKDSILEVTTNLSIGMCIAFLSQIIWFPMIGKDFTIMDNILTTVFFSAVSVLRGYWIRRLFNGRSVYLTIKSKIRRLYDY